MFLVASFSPKQVNVSTDFEFPSSLFCAVIGSGIQSLKDIRGRRIALSSLAALGAGLYSTHVLRVHRES